MRKLKTDHDALNTVMIKNGINSKNVATNIIA